MKKLLTLVAGYAAGLAVAMKYRKSNGKSKLNADPSKSGVDNFIEEVVDIHKSAYGDAKEYVESNLEGVKDLDTLKSKVSQKLGGLADQAEDIVASIKDRSQEKKAELENEAKSTASGISDVVVGKLANWIEGAKTKLDTAHTAVKSKLDTEAPAKKPVTKKKPAPSKTPKA